MKARVEQLRWTFAAASNELMIFASLTFRPLSDAPRASYRGRR
jgi:hypothetical protein